MASSKTTITDDNASHYLYLKQFVDIIKMEDYDAIFEKIQHVHALCLKNPTKANIFASASRYLVCAVKFYLKGERSIQSYKVLQIWNKVQKNQSLTIQQKMKAMDEYAALLGFVLHWRDLDNAITKTNEITLTPQVYAIEWEAPILNNAEEQKASKEKSWSPEKKS